MVIDEVVQLTKELHDFLNELFKQIRLSVHSKYFGGIQVILSGDPLQKRGGFIDKHM